MSGAVELPVTAALLVIDMQNGFCHPEGAVARAGLDIEMHRSAVPKVAELVEATDAAGLPVIWSRQEHLEDDRGRLSHRLATHTEKGGYLPCVRGTWDAEIVDELQALVRPEHVVVVKHRASCFYSTTLELELRVRGVNTLVVTGVSTNYCVDSTIRDAYARDYDLIVVEDACGAIDRDLHDATIKNAAMFHGAVVTTAAAAKALERLDQGSGP